MFTVKSALKRSLSLILVCVTLLTVLPFSSSAAITTGEITQALTSLKNTAYPQNNYWCGGDISTSLSYSGCGRAGGCTCNVFAYSSQCHGFALYLAQRLMGSYPKGSLYTYTHGAVSGSWTCYTKSALGTSALCAMGLQPGDIIRAATDSRYSNGHTAIVWKVENGKVYFAESWGSVYCKINWGGFNYASYSMSAICSKYAYVALWRNSEVVNQGGCTHTFKEGHDTQHPHRIYTECSNCKLKEYTGKYFSDPECVCCLGQHDYTISYEESHPHYEVKTCSLCNSIVYSGESKKNYSCPQCLGLPFDLEISVSAESLKAGEQLTVNYSAENAASFTVTVMCGTKIIDSFSTVDTRCTVPLPYVGDYTINVMAVSPEGKNNSISSNRITVKAPITEVTENNGTYSLKYDLSLDKKSAEAFAAERKLTLTEYSQTGFTASFTLTDKFCDINGNDLYIYYPVSLSYYEIKDFCALTGKKAAYASNAEENDIISSLCTKADAPGILLDANDTAIEGSWVYGNSSAPLSYKNWHETYTGDLNTGRNYLFMYPDGKWTDCEAMPSYGHGFVAIEPPVFKYSENADGTLTLTGIPVKSGRKLSIPSNINGKAVTSIADLALAHSVFDKVVIPDSVTSISDSAFAYANIELFCIPRDWALEDYFSGAAMNYIYSMPFTDISESAWYYDSLYYCYSSYYISGTSKTALSPSMACTREMFVTVLSRVMKADISGYGEASSFVDVLPGQWYSGAIEWAFSNDITEGIGNDRFGLGQAVTREQIAVFLSNLHVKGEQTEDLSRFTDAGEISDWALESMRWAIAEKVISGTSATTLDPKRTAMRTELCQMIYNYCKIFES